MLTFHPTREIPRLHPKQIPRKHRYATNTQSYTPPQPLDDPLFRHAVPNSDPQHPIRMLDQRKVASLDHILLAFFTVVESDFFGRLEKARVCEAELAFEGGYGLRKLKTLELENAADPREQHTARMVA